MFTVPDRGGVNLDAVLVIAGRILQVEGNSIDADTPLAFLGFDSITAQELSHELEKMSGLSLPSEVGMESLTAREICELSDNERVSLKPTVASEDVCLRPERRVAGSSFRLTPIQESYVVGRYEEHPSCPCQVCMQAVQNLVKWITHTIPSLAVIYREIVFFQLDLNRFWAVVNSIVSRHDMLRAALTDDQTEQLVLEPRGVPSEAASRRPLSQRREECMHSFVGRPDLFWRVALTQLSEGKVCVHILYDMVFLDAASFGILAREAYTLYNDSQAKLPQVHASFEDYCRQLKQRSVSTASREYWASRITDMPGPPQLPRKATPTVATRAPCSFFERESVMVDACVWLQLKRHSVKLKASPFAVLLAMLFEAISFHADDPHFSITITRSDRPAGVEFANVVGDFTAASILSMRVERGGPPASLISAVHKDVADALAHRDVSNAEVVRMLRERHASPHLIFPIVFTSWLGVHLPAGYYDCLAFARTKTPQVELDIKCIEVGNQLQLDFDYCPFTYVRHTISHLSKTYQSLLCTLASFEEDELAHRPLRINPQPFSEAGRSLTSPERKVFTRTHLLHELVFEAARAMPAKLAVVDQAIRLTFGDLIRLVSIGAAALRSAHANEPRPYVQNIAIVCEKGWEQVVAAVAITCLGFAYLPINPSHPDHHIEHVLQLAGTRIGVAQQKTTVNRSWMRATVKVVHFDTLLGAAAPHNARLDPLVEVSADHLAYISVSRTPTVPLLPCLTWRDVRAFNRLLVHLLQSSPPDRLACRKALRSLTAARRTRVSTS